MASYPEDIPALTRPVHSDPAIDNSPTDATVIVDAISDEIEAIATELGVSPSGEYVTVVERLDAFDADSRLSDTRVPTDASVTDAKIATTLSPSKITGTAVVTSDSRLSDARTPTDASVTDAKIATTLSPSKITGTAVVTADARLSNTRTPTALSVTDASVSATAAIAQSKIASLVTDLAGKASAATIGNLLTANQASVETDASGWTTFDNSSVARVASTFGHGAWCLELTRGPIDADDGRALSNPRPAVIPGQTYTASALIDGYTNGGTILLFFYDSSGNGVGQVNGSNVPAGVTASRTVSMVAPPTAASAGLIIVTNSTAGATRFDNMGIWAGAGGDWALPGVPITGTSPTEARSLTGTGSPNSVITAPVGSTYTDTAASGGVIRWTKFTGSGNTGWLADPIDSAVVHKAGTETITGAKTFTSGNPTVTSASGNPYFISNASDTGAERTAGVLFQRRGATRWVVAKSQTAESGSNSGSGFTIIRYDDAGNFLGEALTINRSNGEVLIGETTAGTAHLRLGRSAGNVSIITGTGFPEGVITAPVGSMYTDTAATNGAIRWIKATGSGNTGWKVEYGDTGWRDLSATSLSNGWAYYVSYFRMRRVNQEVHVGMYLDATSATSDTVGSSIIPTGFRTSFQTIIAAPRGIGRDQTNVVNIEPTTLYVRNRIADGNAVYIDTNYMTNDAWPATLPGTAA